MSETTTRLNLPLIAASQAQKHVPVNEALLRLDALVQLSVIDRTRTEPPVSPASGDRHIVDADASGSWVGQDGKIAVYDAGWIFLTPAEGWFAWVSEDEEFVVFSDGGWIPFSGGAGGAGAGDFQNVPLFGLAAEADETNPFSAKLNNALWTSLEDGEGGTGDLRYVMNKQAGTNILSLLMQSGYSGRVEFGLIGDEDLLFKVSADGSTWREAIRVDKSTGRVRFPHGGVREQLTANRTYYVRTDGSNGNDGLTNSAGGAFLTIQKAIDTTLGSLDLAGFDVTIQVADGTYTNAVDINAAQIGKGQITIQGNSGTPSNVLISVTGASCFKASAGGAKLLIKDLKLQTTTAGYGIEANAGSHIQFSNIVFGTMAVSYSHITVAAGGLVEAVGNYSIAGGCNCHWDVNSGRLFVGGRTITITGVPAFGVAFARLQNVGFLQAWGNTYSGSATGARYSVSANSILQTFGAGTSVLPGNSAGTTASGGQYL